MKALVRKGPSAGSGPALWIGYAAKARVIRIERPVVVL